MSGRGSGVGRRPPRWGSVAALAAAVLTPALATAAPARRIAILPAVLTGPSAEGAPSPERVFEHAAAVTRGFVELETLEYGALVIEGESSLGRAVRDCASDLRCIGRALAERDLDLGLRVIVNLAIEPPLLTLGLIPRAAPPGAGTPLDPDPLEGAPEAALELAGPGALEAELSHATERLLLDAGLTRGARLTILVSPPEARLTVRARARALRERPRDAGAEPAPSSPAAREQTFVVAPGRVAVAAELEGHEAAAGEVDLAAGTDGRLELHLAPSSSSPEAGGGPPWLWIAGGALAAGAAAALIVVAADPFGGPEGPGCLCITTTSGGCAPCP